jgi:hypothetical protein
VGDTQFDIATMADNEKDLADVSHINDIDAASSDAILLATAADTTAYSPWSLPMFRLYGVLSIAYLCGCLNGFDGSLMGAINAMTPYQNYYGVSVSFSHLLNLALLIWSAVDQRDLQQALFLQSTTLDLSQLLFSPVL